MNYGLRLDLVFCESLGFIHYLGSPFVDEKLLEQNHLNRIYDTFIDEDQLPICDDTIYEIVKSLQSSHILHMNL